MKKTMNHIEHTIICMLICYFEAPVFALIWKVQRNYVINGHHTVLDCNTRTCETGSIRKWIGGPNYEVLAYCNSTTNSSKYESSNVSTTNFYLTIKNFSISDLNCKYTCACGLQQYTKELKLDDVNYIYPPKIDVKCINEYSVDIRMDVYPLPKCIFVNKIDLKPENSTVKMIDFTQTYAKNKEIYNVHLYRSFREAKDIDCRGYLNVYCQVGHLNYTIAHDGLYMCKAKIFLWMSLQYFWTLEKLFANRTVYTWSYGKQSSDRTPDAFTVFSMAGLSVLFVAIVLCCIYSHCKCTCRRFRNMFNLNYRRLYQEE